MSTFNVRRVILLLWLGIKGEGESALQAELASPSTSQSLGAPSLSPPDVDRLPTPLPHPCPILLSQQIQTIPSMESPAGSRVQASALMAHHVGCTCVTEVKPGLH